MAFLTAILIFFVFLLPISIRFHYLDHLVAIRMASSMCPDPCGTIWVCWFQAILCHILAAYLVFIQSAFFFWKKCRVELTCLINTFSKQMEIFCTLCCNDLRSLEPCIEDEKNALKLDCETSNSVCCFCLTYILVSSVLWHCWLGVRNSIWPVKIEWWGVGVVICVEWGADCLHMVQLMQLPSQNSIIFCLI